MRQPSDIRTGLLEYILGTDKANKVRDSIPFLNPRCTWGLKINRCGKHAEVRHRVSERFDWMYSCKLHGFHPDYHDILGRVNRPGNSESHWEWIGEEQEPPKYRMPEILK